MVLMDDKYPLPEGDIDVVCLGETLLDMITSNEVQSLADGKDFLKNFGGSPANIAVNLTRLKNKVALISRIGDDPFGDFICRVLEDEGIIIDGIQRDKVRRTPVIFVSKSRQTPEWLPYRDADTYLEENKELYNLIDRTRVFHLSTFILSQKPARTTALKAFAYAKEKGKILSFDPCYREVLWPEEDDGAEVVKGVISRADFIKPSLDDAYHLFGQDTPEGYLEKYLELGPKVVLLTMGDKGVLASDGNKKVHIPIFSQEVVDVTGAGDSFWSGFLTGILDGMSIQRSIKLGNGTAAFKIQGLGALSPIPEKEKIMETFNI